MNEDHDDARVFTRRAFIIGVMQTGLLAVLGGRLAWLQVVEGQRYKMMSDKNRINLKILAPSRGQIVDRAGVILAANNQNFRVMVIREQTDDLEKSLRSLRKFIPLDDESIQNILKLAKKTPKYAPLEVKDNLQWEQVARVELNLPDLPGLLIDVGESRTYPLGDATAHIIGYVGAINKSEVTEEPLLNLPDFKIGKTGIEKSHDVEMRGKAGTSEVEVNVIGREVRELSKTESVPGEKITLTLDAALQKFAQDRIAVEPSASAVVMDVQNGKIYALASHPGFDPNVFSRGIPATLWEELLANPANPLTNKAVAGLYPPASTFKMITALAGLKAGRINKNRRVFCPGHFSLGRTVFHCWKPAGHGSVNVVEAIKHSCDTFFYQIAMETGIDNIAAMARRLGLGDKMSFELPEERNGLVPDQAWKKKERGEKWHQGETVIAGIGQGYMLATPLQLAVMTARIANGGKAVKPWLTPQYSQESWPDMEIPAEHMKIVQEGMFAVVNVAGGTGMGSRIAEPGMEMAGKTGTAQVRRITKAQRASGVQNKDLPWKHRHHALFVGYAPVENPRYACAVVVEHGVGGAAAAAPIAKDILLEAQKRGIT
ncbi:MAG: penicillin-binding protein 2 [Alphaproteobacteria bacterium]